MDGHNTILEDGDQGAEAKWVEGHANNQRTSHAAPLRAGRSPKA